MLGGSFDSEAWTKHMVLPPAVGDHALEDHVDGGREA